MRKVFFTLITLCVCTISFSQRRPEIKFSYFKQIANGEIMPANAVIINGYTGVLEESNYVSENPKTAASISRLVNNLKANGTGDINKCFIPRHAITFVRGDSAYLQVLICFECDGIRFSTQSQTTNVKSIAKREKWMKELKQWFNAYHFYDRKKQE